MKKLFLSILLLIFAVIIWKFFYNPIQLRKQLIDLITPISSPDPVTIRTDTFILGDKKVNYLITNIQTRMIQSSMTKTKGPFTSTLTLQGVYEISAGFNLDDYTKVEVDTLSSTAVVTISKPKIISAEQKKLFVLNDDGSWVIVISHEEHSKMAQDMNNLARNPEDNSDAIDHALENFRHFVKLTGKTWGYDVRVELVPEISEQSEQSTQQPPAKAGGLNYGFH